MRHIVYLALGTNLGDRLGNLKAALEGLSPQVQVLDRSRVYETPPWGYHDQPRFLNQVVKAETELSPEDLLAYLKGLETRLGRQKSFKNGPRLIDIDILFYDDRTLEIPGLSIPHPRLGERAFVLVPLADLTPDLRHPALKVTVQELLDQADRSGIEVYSFED